MQKISTELSTKITNATFVCTLLIVAMHLPYAGVNSCLDANWFKYITHLAVPLFFCISGFLTSHSLDKHGISGLLLSRLKSLVIPYFVLNTLLIPYLYVYHNVLGLGKWCFGGRC